MKTILRIKIKTKARYLSINVAVTEGQTLKIDKADQKYNFIRNVLVNIIGKTAWISIKCVRCISKTDKKKVKQEKVYRSINSHCLFRSVYTSSPNYITLFYKLINIVTAEVTTPLSQLLLHVIVLRPWT